MPPYRRFEDVFDRMVSLYSDSEDAELTARGAAVLGVKEFAFFRLAHRWWFGEDVTDAALEKPFMRFLKARVAPPWVRHFAREVLELDRVGRLDRTAYGLPSRCSASPTLLRIDGYLRVAYAIIWFAAVMTLLIGTVF